jgi:hypothetical protein
VFDWRSITDHRILPSLGRFSLASASLRDSSSKKTIANLFESEISIGLWSMMHILSSYTHLKMSEAWIFVPNTNVKSRSVLACIVSIEAVVVPVMAEVLLTRYVWLVVVLRVLIISSSDSVVESVLVIVRVWGFILLHGVFISLLEKIKMCQIWFLFMVNCHIDWLR